MNDQQTLNQFDEWLVDESPYAAIVMRQWLDPVEGKGAVIFPPTYAKPEGKREDEWLGYNMDRFENGMKVCQIDSVGSQANRMEPIFKNEPYSKLVPQITIQAGDREINLLDAGHRAADAIVRFSDLKEELKKAFLTVREKGNAGPLAKIAPTSIVFGSWDSRETQVKLPRIIRSVIRAYDVEMLHRSAQYTTIAGELLADGEVEVTTKGPKAEMGLAHVPAPWTHGGVIVRKEIRRDAALNLAAVRALKAEPPEGTLALRRYILGLSLVCFTAPQETFLREGCQLVPDPEKPAEWEIVSHHGQRDPFSLSHEKAREYAVAAASAFGVGASRIARFDKKAANDALKKKDKKSKEE
ncbi:MAG TPA: type I-U CRISPR-associated RAMP protein Csb1/Cas7u [bacterium]|nr:type I-U CRISPR-associated RAMP protein Csb1/Cas7u [bacterium]HOL95172.1 type I-U CRISPR-associated RAMP protein Csb1/Cas7u [bacterium]HPO99647.1 type I-U CRISPR-associated RAMP protein Csb1/Cas7u [bacterium]